MYTPNRGAELYSKEALGNSHVGTNYMLYRQSISTYIYVFWWPDVKEQLLNYILTNNVYDCTNCLDDSD